MAEFSKDIERYILKASKPTQISVDRGISSIPACVDVGDQVVLGPISADCKPIVVGIDFGTAYSGVAVASKLFPDKVKCSAPTARDTTQVKVPTALLELPGNVWEFGNEAENHFSRILMDTPDGEEPAGKLYKGFKMLLKGADGGFDTLRAYSTAGSPCKLMTLIAKSLEFLKNHALDIVAEVCGGTMAPTTDIQWVLTVPAIWTDFGKAFMRQAAFEAGLITNIESDNLMLVLEPEGASLAVHVGASQFGLLGEGSRFMVLDCGGGTVDITVHEVSTVNPLRLKSIAAPCGGAWGGERVNDAFRNFLRELLGPELCDEQRYPLTLHTINADFEQLKVMFDPTQLPASLQLVDLLNQKTQLIELAAAWNAKHPDKPILQTNTQRNGFLTMSVELMLSFFEPLLAATVAEAQRILREVVDLRYIMVVGGFGSSKALTARIRREFHGQNGVRVIVPDVNPKPQGAIVHGAVLFGLHNDIVRSRVAAHTYGIEITHGNTHHIFRILAAKGTELPLDHHVSKTLIPATTKQSGVTWKLFRSDEVNPTTTIGQHFLGSLRIEVPPDDNRKNRKVKGIFCFGGAEIRVSGEDVNGKVTRGHITMG